MKKNDSILKEVLKNIEPPKEDLKLIDDSLKDFLKRFNQKIKSSKIKAEVFVGGSFAKRTVIKKDYYDVDVFLRFDKSYKDSEISVLTKKILKDFKNISVIHGSRDYFRLRISPDFFIELIPVMKVNNPKESSNITDLSYSHVKYINKKIKSEKILNDIRIAKAFCHATQCYGAESYIKGFSGYSLELLVYYYGSFLKFVKAMTKVKLSEKLIIDIEKIYKPKSNILIDINTSKLNSPIILIDPTYKQRNVLAALSEETFKKFQKECEKLLKFMSIKSFEVKKIDLEKIKQNAIKNKNEFILLEVKTPKQEGDVAGSKLLKFYNHLEKEIEKFFLIKNKGFNYNRQNSARYFFVVKKRAFVLFGGPFKKDKKNSAKFKKEHKKVFEKAKKLYAKEKIPFSAEQFIQKWKIKNKKRIKEMSINGLKVI